jgi:hypothetical protein
VKVAASTPHATWRLVAVSPDVAELLAVIALSKAICVSVGLHFNRDMTEACQFEDVLRFLGPGKCDQK